MCNLSDAATTFVSTLTKAAVNVGVSAINAKQNEKIQSYKTQIALNNIEAQKDEAKQERQLGIEEARQKKLDAIKSVSSLKAQNASSGFDLNSLTNEYNSKDILDLADIEAQRIKDNSNLKANNILKSAKSNFYALANEQNSYNNSILGSLVSLGRSSQISDIWTSWGQVTDNSRSNF